MELKIMATIPDETGVDSGGLLMEVARRWDEKAYPHSIGKDWPPADAWVLVIT